MKIGWFWKRYKKIAVLLVFAVLFIFAGCGRKAPPEPPESGSLPAMQHTVCRDDCRPASAEAGTQAWKIRALYSPESRKL